MAQLSLSELSKTTPPESILEHEIRLKAYELYEKHGKRNGDDLRDWLQAEEEVLGQRRPLVTAGKSSGIPK